MISLFTGAISYEIGVADLHPVNGHPFTFCANVSLNSSKYNDILPILSTASVDWTAATNGDNVYNANAAQTNVIGTILTICIYIAGGLKNMIPRASWMSFQENIHFRTNNTITGGSIPLNVAVTGATLCAKFLIQVSSNINICIHTVKAG